MTAATIPTASRVIDAHLALNEKSVARIQQSRGYPAVSILLAVGSTHKADSARLAGLVESATVRLLGEFARPAVQPLLDDLADLVLAATVEIGHGHQSLALFANRDLVAAVTLPTRVRDRVVVDETFATRDLVHALLRSPRYRILVLGGEVTRLYAGVGAVLTENTNHGFPVRGPDPSADDQPRYGVDRSARREARLHRDLHAIDAAVAGHLRDDEPFLVVGSGRRLSSFRQRSHHRARITDTLSGTLERSPLAELAHATWPTVTQMFQRRHHEALAEVDRATGARRCAFGVQEVWALANEGRGALAVVEENYTYAARIEPHTNHLVAAADVEHPDVIDDVVDEILEVVLAKGGRVAIVPDFTLAQSGQIAMALRY